MRTLNRLNKNVLLSVRDLNSPPAAGTRTPIRGSPRTRYPHTHGIYCVLLAGRTRADRPDGWCSSFLLSPPVKQGGHTVKRKRTIKIGGTRIVPSTSISCIDHCVARSKNTHLHYKWGERREAKAYKAARSAAAVSSSRLRLV